MKNYYLFLNDTVLGYVDGFGWIPKTTLNHHRLASTFSSDKKPGSPEFGVEVKTFLEGCFGAVDSGTLNKVSLEAAEKYYEQEEQKATSPWAIAQGMIEAGAKRMLLYGPPGVGKSFTPWKVSQRLKATFHSVTLTDMTPMAELRGHFVIRGMDSVWHDGILVRSWRDSHKNRTIMVLNEIDHVGADAESFLHNFLDDPEMARIYLPTGEEITPGNIQVVATMNGEPEDLADALRDRFTVKVEITQPHPEAIQALPENLRDFARRMILEPKNPAERMSLRAFNDFVRLVEGTDKKTSSVVQAARAIFGARGDDVVQAFRVATAK